MLWAQDVPERATLEVSHCQQLTVAAGGVEQSEI